MSEFGAVFEMTNAQERSVTRQELAKTQQNTTLDRYNHRLRRRCNLFTLSRFLRALASLDYVRL